MNRAFLVICKKGCQAYEYAPAKMSFYLSKATSEWIMDHGSFTNVHFPFIINELHSL
jgi:hypothetical protein